MLAFPNAKINLGLNIVEKRSDGYHNIESVFYPVKWQEALEIITAENMSFRYEGIKIPGDAKDNICLKAYELLQRDFALEPVSIFLLKQTPIGAGLGGGSSDGAYTLLLLNDLFDLNLTIEQLKLYAAQLGSDCSFFIENKPVYVTKTGTQLEAIDLDLSDYQALLIYPNIHISTVWAYGQIQPQKPEHSVLDIIKQPVKAWQKVLKNDFQAPIEKSYPDIGSITENLYDYGAHYAAMSGSGSTVYGIFPIDKSLKKAEHFFKEQGYSIKTCAL